MSEISTIDWRIFSKDTCKQKAYISFIFVAIANLDTYQVEYYMQSMALMLFIFFINCFSSLKRKKKCWFEFIFAVGYVRTNRIFVDWLIEI